jgi:hypothetical protein
VLHESSAASLIGTRHGEWIFAAGRLPAKPSQGSDANYLPGRGSGGEMIFQTPSMLGGDLYSGLTSFVTTMVGLSVASERVTETFKQLFTAFLNRLKPNISSAVTQIVAILSGIFVTVLSGQDPIHTPGFQAYEWTNHHNWGSWLFSGILVSGGSAFWNHILDILKATKVQKEQLANAVLPDGGKIAH